MSNSRTAPGETSQWLFDYVFEMLHSPAWEVPIGSFMDEHCLVFDAEEENKLVYTELHNEFKDLVEGVLNQQLAEVGVCEEDFYSACDAVFSRGQSDEQGEYAQEIVEQIIACADFLTFRKLMFRRNKALELEALSSYLDSGENLDAEDDYVEGKSCDQEGDQLGASSAIDLEGYDPDEALAEAIRESTIMAGGDLEQQQRLAAIELEEAELETAIALSLAMEEERMVMDQSESKSDQPDAAAGAKGRKVDQFASEMEWRAESKLEAPGSASGGAKKTGPVLSPLKSSISSASMMARQGSSIAEQRKAVEALLASEGQGRSRRSHQSRAQQLETLKSNGVDEVDIARRTKHLKQQRDRILKRKQEERKAKLEEYTSSKKNPSKVYDNKTSHQQKVDTKITHGQQLTYALARKMKHDLVSGDLASNSLDAKLREMENLRKEKATLVRDSQTNRRR